MLNTIYCKSCLNEYLLKNGNKCPSSNKVIKQDPQNVPVIQFAINSLEMICKNNISGCAWKGKCKEYKDHINNHFIKETIKCMNKGCTELILYILNN